MIVLSLVMCLIAIVLDWSNLIGQLRKDKVNWGYVGGIIGFIEILTAFVTYDILRLIG